MPLGAWALGEKAAESPFGVSICGIPMTEENQKDILGDGTISVEARDGGFVLTLNNANINSKDSAFVYVSKGDLMVKLIGQNFVNTAWHGFFTKNGNLSVMGDNHGASLSMEGGGIQFYGFNELNDPARADITIDNCVISVTSNNRHAISGRQLTIQNQASVKMKTGKGYAGCVFLYSVVYGNGIGMLTRNIEFSPSQYFFVDTKTGAYPFEVEIGPIVPGIQEETTLRPGSSAVVGGSVTVDGITISLGSDDKTSSRYGSIVMTSSMTTAEVIALLGHSAPDSEAFLNTFKGICFEKAAGNGSYEIIFQTSGDYQMTVMNGDMVVDYVQSSRGTITIDYDIAEPEWTLIYPTLKTGAAGLRTRGSSGNLQLYQLKVVPKEVKATGIQEITPSTKPRQDGYIYNLNGQRVTNPKSGLYIINGKKVIYRP